MVHVNETIVMFLYVLSKHQSNTRPLALFPPIFSIILIFFPSDLHFSKNNRTFALEDAIVRRQHTSYKYYGEIHQPIYRLGL